MSYPYPHIEKLFQVKCSPAEYLKRRAEFAAEQQRRHLPSAPIFGHPYWEVIPTYTYAVCPWCGYRLQEQIDTYHLSGWQGNINDLSWGLSGLSPHSEAGAIMAGAVRFPHCPHFWGVHFFINLHGLPPEDIHGQVERGWVNNGEQPYITPWYFEDEWPPVKAVLHALPLGRIRENKFMPAYTAFCLTYFTIDRLALLDKWRAQAERNAAEEDRYYPSRVLVRGFRDSEPYQLAAWVKRGALGWLDFTQADLPLIFKPDQELPAEYQTIPYQPQKRAQLARRIWSRLLGKKT